MNKLRKKKKGSTTNSVERTTKLKRYLLLKTKGKLNKSKKKSTNIGR